MAVKRFVDSEIGDIYVQKRRGTKSLRLRIGNDAVVRVTQPTWLPFSAGYEFAKSRTEWLSRHRKTPEGLVDGMLIGIRHTLRIIDSEVSSPRATVQQNEVIVRKPKQLPMNHETVQRAAKRGSRKALEAEGETLIGLTQELSQSIDIKHSGITLKFLRSKWGSCDSRRHITLNYRLLDVPDELIEYVIIHELSHIKHMNHSPAFWAEVGKHIPDYKERRKRLKTVVLPW